jgi:hypothetical protein
MLSDYNETISVQALPLCVCVYVEGAEKKGRNSSVLLDRPSFWRLYPSVCDLVSVTKQTVDYIYVCIVKPYDVLKVTNALAMPLSTPFASY